MADQEVFKNAVCSKTHEEIREHYRQAEVNLTHKKLFIRRYAKVTMALLEEYFPWVSKKQTNFSGKTFDTTKL